MAAPTCNGSEGFVEHGGRHYPSGAAEVGSLGTSSASAPYYRGHIGLPATERPTEA
jgi:hypothetical protein